MTGWQPIETIPANERPKLIAFSGGSVCIAPGVAWDAADDKQVRRAMAKAGHWPNHREFTPILWMYVPDVPTERPLPSGWRRMWSALRGQPA